MVDDDCCACAAAKDATVGVDAEEGEVLDEVTAKMCVGKADDDGEFGVGRRGTSKQAGRRDFGNELGVDNKLTAAIIL